MIKQFFSNLFGRTERGLFTIEPIKPSEMNDTLLCDENGKPYFFIDGRESDKEMEEKVKLYNQSLKALGFEEKNFMKV